ncbi:AMP-binding protein [Caenimonas sedimenti]|uniref:AMP-binding protein n=1 Tax=Caenimonas sedimenti TaxID=2596921 RepID=A0A562ZEP5_9BURK|nr:AMP-binding protein [Caenimonas sedimenti]TWO66022.1 AMP-binding protein [Caenimonas sedimenti]
MNLILERVYHNEARQPGKLLFTQPLGNGAVRDITWGEALDEARRMAAHLQGLGIPRGSNIAMLAKNSAHFMLAELAIWMAGGCTVAIFPTDSPENVRYVLEHSEAKLLFVGKLDAWGELAAAVPAGLPCIALPLAPVTPEQGIPAWDDIIARTAPLQGRPQRGEDDVAMLLYTSGSTGQPKGVMQTFGSISRVTQALQEDSAARYGPDQQWRMLSYLPLAHCFERAYIECQAFAGGRTHVFFVDSLTSFMDDLRRARPTAFISVPRLWTKFQQAVFAGLPPAQLDAMLANPAMAPAVRKKVLDGLGLADVITAGSGSAPLPGDLKQWYLNLGMDLHEGYGMTEDFAYSHARGYAAGSVGKAHPGVAVRLADDGEILIRSPGQMRGYYKRPDLDAESFTEDGFFRTGDIGHYDENGELRLTGRKKELFKTSKGEYVAPAPIESKLNAHPMVELSIVSGVSQPAPYAVLMLDENLRPRLGDAEVRAQVQGALQKLLQEVNASLAQHQRLAFLVVAGEPWSIQNGCLTATMKIRRSRIEAGVAQEVERWYGKADAVIWA